MSDIAALIERHSAAVDDKIKNIEKKADTVKLEMLNLEQAFANIADGPGVDAAPPSWGSEFVATKGADLAALRNERGRIVGMEVKATLTSTAAAALSVPHKDATLGLPQRRLTVRQLLTVVDVRSGSVEYPRLSSRALNADAVAEGDLKPESGLTFELMTAPIRTIAHWIPASLQVLDDEPQLRSLIDTELTYGVALKEENELLNGSGAGQHLLGMVTQATAFAAPGGIEAISPIDKLGAAVLQASLTETPPDGMIVNPIDWWRMRLQKDGDGKYLLGDPASTVEQRLFGLPVVVTPAMTAGKFLVGGFKAQTLYDRWKTRIDVSTEHADFFVRNLCAIRAENRIGFAAKRPEALIYGSFA